MSNVVPLKPPSTDDESAYTPEAMFISALLETGQWTPLTFSVTDEHLNTHEKVWRFCADFQARIGEAPSPEEVAGRFPDFRFIPGVNPTYAAKEVREAHEERLLKRGLQATIRRLNELGVDQAKEELRPLLATGGKIRADRPTGLFDPRIVADAEIKHGWNVPYQKLMAVTQGIGRGELWYVAARMTGGKTWLLCLFIDSLVRAGARVSMLSAEMPKRTVGHRIHCLLAPDKETRIALKSPIEKIRQEALEKIKSLYEHEPQVFDKTDFPMDTSVLPEVAGGCDVMVIDYIGKLTHQGKMAIEDYRIQAMISGVAQDTAAAHNIGVLAAAQINRAGDTGGLRPPKLSDIADSDHIPRDGDVVVTFKRPCDTVWSMSAEKVREGPEPRWYAKFNPSAYDFKEISKEQALTAVNVAGAAALAE